MRASSIQQMQFGISPAALIAGAVVLLALPSAVLAFSANFEPRAEVPADVSKSDFIPASGDPRLARQITVASLPKGQVFRFTPAGISTRSNRSVTVAVRVDASGRLRALSDITLPGRYAELFTEIPAHRFRLDTSSTEIRKRGQT